MLRQLQTLRAKRSAINKGQYEPVNATHGSAFDHSQIETTGMNHDLVRAYAAITFDEINFYYKEGHTDTGSQGDRGGNRQQDEERSFQNDEDANNADEGATNSNDEEFSRSSRISEDAGAEEDASGGAEVDKDGDGEHAFSKLLERDEDVAAVSEDEQHSTRLTESADNGRFLGAESDEQNDNAEEDSDAEDALKNDYHEDERSHMTEDNHAADEESAGEVQGDEKGGNNSNVDEDGGSHTPQSSLAYEPEDAPEVSDGDVQDGDSSVDDKDGQNDGEVSQYEGDTGRSDTEASESDELPDGDEAANYTDGDNDNGGSRNGFDVSDDGSD